MRVVMALAVAALVALIVALLTGSTWPALAVVALAGAGIVLLLRDWRADRSVSDESAGGEWVEEHPEEYREEHTEHPAAEQHADDFSPDISTDPDGPSSDARSDQL